MEHVIGTVRIGTHTFADIDIWITITPAVGGLPSWHGTFTSDVVIPIETPGELTFDDGRSGAFMTTTVPMGSPYVIHFQGHGPLA